MATKAIWQDLNLGLTHTVTMLVIISLDLQPHLTFLTVKFVRLFPMIFNFNIRVEHHLASITIDHSHGLFIFFVRSFAVIFDLSIRVELHLEFITFEL